MSWAVFALAYLISLLKSKFTADIIHIPTLQKFSNPIDSLYQVYLICREDTLYGAFEELIDFMTQTKGKAFLTNIESNYNFMLLQIRHLTS